MSEAEQVQTDGANPPPVNDVEQRARTMGWVTKEEFKGDPSHWRPADEFVSRGENLLPILQKQLRSMESKINHRDKKIEDLQSTLSELRDFSRQASEREYKKAREALQAEAVEAAKEANPEKAARAVQQLDALDSGRKPDKPADKKSDQKGDPEIQEWIEKEKWFTSSPMLNGAATEIYGELERDAPGLSTAERLAETKKRVSELFPEKFGVSKRQTAAAVAAPSGGAPPKKGKSYDDLPSEAKKACDRFVKTIPGYKREDYVRDFDWSSV